MVEINGMKGIEEKIDEKEEEMLRIEIKIEILGKKIMEIDKGLGDEIESVMKIGDDGVKKKKKRFRRLLMREEIGDKDLRIDDGEDESEDEFWRKKMKNGIVSIGKKVGNEMGGRKNVENVVIDIGEGKEEIGKMFLIF